MITTPPRWPFMAAPSAPASAGPPNTVTDPADWVQRCAARLAELVQDDGVGVDDLRAVAAAMAEEPAYAALEPEAAADLQLKLEA